MIHRSVLGARPLRRFLALTLSALTTAALPVGCGSDKVVTSGPPESVKINPDEIYKWEGKGRAKHKTGLDPHERRKMRRAIASKEGSS